MRAVRTMVVLVAMAAAMAGCACRSGYVGPYGGVHPGGCVLF